MPVWFTPLAALAASFVLVEHRCPHAPVVNRPCCWQRRLRNFSLWAVSQALPLGALVAASAVLAPESAPFRVLRSHGWPWPVMLMLELLLLDALHYAMHVAAHRMAWIWPFHAVHHADDALDATTGLLQHPGERLLFTLMQLPVVIGLGISPTAVSVYAPVVLAFGLMHHANVRLPARWEKKLRRFVVTPGFHRPHHHRHRPYTDTNFGFVLSVWDRLFQTQGVADTESIAGFSPGLNDHGRLSVWRSLRLPLDELIAWKRRQATKRPRQTVAPGRKADSIPCTIMRGGSSKGLFFQRSDLAADHGEMLAELRRVLGTGSPRGVDGLGGLDPLANKVAVVSRATDDQADLDYWFAQVADLQRGLLDDGVSCGNILAAVGPFALESGLVRVNEPTATLRIRSLNTGHLTRVSFATSGGRPVYEGPFQLAGVPGTGAPIELDYAPGTAWPSSELFPGGRRSDELGGVQYTLIRCATTLLIVRAEDFGLIGDEAPQTLNSDAAWLRRLEEFRQEASRRCGLGEVMGSVSPKVSLISRGTDGAHIQSRYFMPLACHPAHAVTGALALAAACRCPGTLAHELVGPASNTVLRIAHPSGSLDVQSELQDEGDRIMAQRLAVTRTARLLMSGSVAVPPAVSASC